MHARDHSSGNLVWPGQPTREGWFRGCRLGARGPASPSVPAAPISAVPARILTPARGDRDEPGRCRQLPGSQRRRFTDLRLQRDDLGQRHDGSDYEHVSGQIRPTIRRRLRPRHGRPSDPRSCHTAVADTRPPAGGSPCCASATLTCRTSSASSTSPAPSTWDNREHAGHYTQATNYLGTEVLTPADTERLLTEIIREM